MKRIPPVAVALVLASVPSTALLIRHAPGVSAQGQTTANMLVSTSVLRKCFVQTAPLDFGEYDPVQTNATAPLDGSANITVACTKGTVVTIGIDNGSNGLGEVRRMSGGATSYLTYDLYQDAGRTLRWGNTAGEAFDGGIAPSRDPRNFIVYGRVPGAQDVAEGSFQDTVLVTVNF